MPWYRVDGVANLVHLRGTKLPPACRQDDGCQRCMRTAGYLCDFPIGPGTCDAPICERHAIDVGFGPEIHYCPRHARETREARSAVTDQASVATPDSDSSGPASSEEPRLA